MANKALSEAESDVLDYFKERSCAILQESEIKSWWEKKFEDASQLCDCLKDLVDCSKLGVRTISVGESAATVYWLKEQVSGPRGTPGGVSSGVTPGGGVSSGVTPGRGVSSGVTLGGSRQRTKRVRSSFVSPLIKDTREKVPKFDHTPSVMGTNIKGRLDLSDTRLHSDPTQSSKVTVESGDNKERLESLKRERETLLTRLSSRKEELRKLRMVKMYRTKNDLQGLEQLTSKWREVAQDAAQCLLESSTSEPRPSMKQLLEFLHIDPELIQYSIEDESFY